MTADVAGAKCGAAALGAAPFRASGMEPIVLAGPDGRAAAVEEAADVRSL